MPLGGAATRWVAILTNIARVRPPNYPPGVCKTMANRAIWSMRKRHEWLATPLKAKKMKRSGRLRCGLQDAIDRKLGTEPVDQSQSNG